MQSLKRIVVIGPESTGKSTLCESLATHYDTVWCREYAREYLLAHGMNYTFEDLLTIAKGQLAGEDNSAAQARNGLLFIDTDMYVMKVWAEFVFGKCHDWILDQIVSRRYDLYLLCNVDLPWVKDELREYPDLESRQQLYRIYKDIMINQSVPWVDISGDYGERLQKAVSGIEKFIL
ncbi:MAG: AAA family ATPase [Bacteroidetes bacterium]|nr:AAA family ATPase [Bacteroidota bacterium]